MNVILIGGGGREHALAWAIARSPRLGSLWTTHPQNPGLAALARAVDVPVSIKEIYRLQQFIKRERINFVVIGPEEPLCEGYADALTSDSVAVFGPTRDAARLEGDKAWAKEFMRSALIPTAEARVFRDARAAVEYLNTRDTPQVVKASGLARGKGVFVAANLEEALEAVDRVMVRREFGAAGDRVVIEERIKGPEVSVFALVDGRNIAVLDACQDHKRLGEGDTGPNTGGMGAYCPTPVIDAEIMDEVHRKVLVPTVDALRRDGIEYRGLLYAGLMLTPAGPKVLEFNVRFGDPECQCLLPRFRGDLLDTLFATATGRLDEADFDWDPRPSCCIVLASPGYPDEPRTGAVIEGLDEAAAMEGVSIFHAGTRSDASGRVVTAGGRVLSVVGIGDSLRDARARALAACDAIHFEGKQYRRDIGWQALGEQQAVPAR
ncbi:MAG TPA: phosphoribosylamine--glycine ligase [Phycisphaerales bacterium]|nr:phosphoribosylamine--glycine ligase [Phycisphaerales bacterium]